MEMFWRRKKLEAKKYKKGIPFRIWCFELRLIKLFNQSKPWQLQKKNTH